MILVVYGLALYWQVFLHELQDLKWTNSSVDNSLNSLRQILDIITVMMEGFVFDCIRVNADTEWNLYQYNVMWDFSLLWQVLLFGKSDDSREPAGFRGSA